jgi:hypothetical protein
MTPDERLAADVFGLTYREYAAGRDVDYKLRLLAPDAVKRLRQGRDELWSFEKLADYLHTDPDEASLRLRRFLMSERVNAGRDTPERISRLFIEWLDRFDLAEGERKSLARDLSRLLSSQLHAAAEQGESLDDVIEGLEKLEAGPATDPSGNPGHRAPGGPDEAGPKSWGPQWKD